MTGRAQKEETGQQKRQSVSLKQSKGLVLSFPQNKEVSSLSNPAPLDNKRRDKHVSLTDFYAFPLTNVSFK